MTASGACTQGVQHTYTHKSALATYT